MNNLQIDHAQIGVLGEKLVLDKLRSLEFQAEMGGPGDILVGKLSVEVKTARPSKHRKNRQPGFQFCIRRFKHSDFNSDFLVLLCISLEKEPLAFFVLPASAVHKGNKIVIPTMAYKGKYAQWLERWDLIEEKL